MIIGILKEPGFDSRVAMLSDTVGQLKGLKVNVLVEEEAGIKAFNTDKEYMDEGAEIKTRSEIIKLSDILLMINPLGDNDLKEIPVGRVLIGAFNPLVNHSIVKSYASANIVSFSLDVIPRTTRAQSMDILSSQASVSGYKAVLDAANRFGGFMNMFMTAAGTIKPAKVLILGAGVAGLQAIATSRKLGAVVESFDVRAAVKEEVQSLGARFIEVEGARDDSSAGGYAVEQTEEFKEKQRQVVHDHAVKSDIIICTAQIPGKKAPILIFRETVEKMSPGSIIIDLAASNGGNCELAKANEVINHGNVIIVGKSNYPSEMPGDASFMFGKNMLNFVKLLIHEDGSLNLNMDDEIVKGTCITFNQQIIHNGVLNAMRI
jgi:H+-translocating NAD(P) transhydrogenase subunit alpha